MLMNLIHNVCTDIILKLQPHLPGANVINSITQIQA